MRARQHYHNAGRRRICLCFAASTKPSRSTMGRYFKQAEAMTNEQRGAAANVWEKRFWRQNNRCIENRGFGWRVLGKLGEDPKVSQIAEKTIKIGEGLVEKSREMCLHQRHTICSAAHRPFYIFFDANVWRMYGGRGDAVRKWRIFFCRLAQSGRQCFGGM